MPNESHEIELIGGPLDGVAWTVPVGQAMIDIPIDRPARGRQDGRPLEPRTHRYELQADGRYRYAGVVVK